MAKPDSAKKERNKTIKWVVTIFFITLLVSATISFVSDIIMENSTIFVAFLILLGIVLIGIIFDVIGVVFQEPMSCMDPLMKIGQQVEESLLIHTKTPKEERRRLALESLAAVELPDPVGVYEKYPHELSGGMIQRCMIAAALMTRPKLLLLDEPTTALDVTIQAQILELLKKVNGEYGISMLFISHNLNVVRKLCGRVAVMQRGHLVEEGLTDEVFYHPREDYTRRLIAAIPSRRRKEEDHE